MTGCIEANMMFISDRERAYLPIPTPQNKYGIEPLSGEASKKTHCMQNLL